LHKNKFAIDPILNARDVPRRGRILRFIFGGMENGENKRNVFSETIYSRRVRRRGTIARPSPAVAQSRQPRRAREAASVASSEDVGSPRTIVGIGADYPLHEYYWTPNVHVQTAPARINVEMSRINVYVQYWHGFRFKDEG